MQKTEFRSFYLLQAIDEYSMNGDTYLSEEVLYRTARKIRRSLDYSVFRRDLAEQIQLGNIHWEGRRLYRARTWRYEVAVAKILSELLGNNQLVESAFGTIEPEGDFLENCVAAYGSSKFLLTDEQKTAVKMGLTHRLSIILGGAGSGKTTLIPELAAGAQDGVVLCAPTGKAAANLWERTGLPARTVHSALGRCPNEDFLSPVEWRHTDVVVVDESSMLTLEMLAGILTTVSAFCRVILVGDPNQLQSVGAGNVLQDLIVLGIPCTRLETIHRQENTQSALAKNIQNFSRCHRLEDLSFDDSFRFVPLALEKDIRRCICEGAAAMYQTGMNLQVLSPYNRSGELSAAKLNTVIRDLVNPASGSNTLDGVRFHNGDRVMILENDWSQQVSNGDIGQFGMREEDDENGFHFWVNCSRGRTARWFGRYELRRLQLGYAITVHKAQGSEYDTVILPMTKGFSNLLYRNLIYTAISRAKKHVVLVGDADAVNIALQQEAPVRKSMLVQRTHFMMREFSNTQRHSA